MSMFFDVVEVKAISTSLAQIVLASEVRTGDNRLAVGWQIAGAGDIDSLIEALKADLDRVAIKAKAITQ